MRSYEKISGSLKNISGKVQPNRFKWILVFQACHLPCRTANMQNRIRRVGKISEDLSRAGSAGYPYYRHPLPVRIMHWSNAVFLPILLMSGLNIFNAHPALYWGKSSYHGVPPILQIGARKRWDSGVTWSDHDSTTGFLGASGPGGDWQLSLLAYLPPMACHGAALALFFAWLPVNGIAFVTPL